MSVKFKNMFIYFITYYVSCQAGSRKFSLKPVFALKVIQQSQQCFVEHIIYSNDAIHSDYYMYTR